MTFRAAGHEVPEAALREVGARAGLELAAGVVGRGAEGRGGQEGGGHGAHHRGQTWCGLLLLLRG